MKNLNLVCFLLIALVLGACASNIKPQSKIRVATFNVSVEASNYLSRAEIAEDPSRANIVSQHLASGDHDQLKNIAEIIQRTRPDIVLLNEFDYIADTNTGIELFLQNYLAVSQNGQQAIQYADYFIAPVNTGIPTPFDLDNNGKREYNGADAFGFGYYPGQYGMALLSNFKIGHEDARTLQNFLWKDMPNALQTVSADGLPWYSDQAWSKLRLSSKSLWDVPILVGERRVHIIAAHPTPPTFDGPEDRNGKRNHDEIRMIQDYASGAAYLYDDRGNQGGLEQGSAFVIVGDLNSSPDEGDSIQSKIKSLLSDPLINASCIPMSEGGKQARIDNEFAEQHTAAWGMRVDYVLPSSHGFNSVGCGVFWPTPEEDSHRLIRARESSSDHRLVWTDLILD